MEDQMSIDEGDLRTSLGSALDELDYGPIPLSSVISQGKTVVLRRRLIAVAGALTVVVAVVLAVAVGPTITHQARRSVRAVTSSPYDVTVHPPGAKSPRGLIAYGRLNHRRWQIAGIRAKIAGKMIICDYSFHTTSCNFMPIPPVRDKGEPVDIGVTIRQFPLALIGTVRSDVRLVVVRLSNGQAATLRPVGIFGRSHAAWIAMMLPYRDAVTKITAYSANGEVGYALPFGRGALFADIRWLAPGQPPPPKPVTYKIAAGKFDGKSWAEYAYVGPSWTCIGDPGAGGTCYSDGLRKLLSRETIVSALMVPPGEPSTGYNVFVAQQAVSYVIVHFKKASPVRVPLIARGGFKSAGITTTPADAMTGWEAYSASGEKLAVASQTTVSEPSRHRGAGHR